MHLRLLCAVAATLASTSPASAAETAGSPAPAPAALPAPRSDQAQAKLDQEALRKMFDRELAPLALSEFETKSHVRGKVEAKGAVASSQSEAGDELSIGIGTAQPLGCGILATRVDAGGTLWNVLERARKSVELLQARPVEVAHSAGDALLFFEVFYRTRSEKPLLGQLKVAIAPHATHSLVCTHDEPGYGMTFRRVVKGLAASLASDADARDAAVYLEQSTASIGEQTVGYEERTLSPREGGGSTSVTYGALFLPRSPAELAILDTISIEVSDADGLLLEKTFIEAQNGQVESQLKITRGEDRRTFRYEGTKSGKKLSGSFPSKAGLATELWFAQRLLRGGGFGKEGVLRHESWSASEPTHSVGVSYEKVAGEPRSARIVLGSMTMSGVLDEHGLVRDAQLPIGPTSLQIRRVFSRGAP